MLLFVGGDLRTRCVGVSPLSHLILRRKWGPWFRVVTVIPSADHLNCLTDFCSGLIASKLGSIRRPQLLVRAKGLPTNTVGLLVRARVLPTNTIGLLAHAKGIPTIGLLARPRGIVITKRRCNSWKSKPVDRRLDLQLHAGDGKTLDNGVPSIGNGPVTSEFPEYPEFAELAISISREWIEG